MACWPGKDKLYKSLSYHYQASFTVGDLGLIPGVGRSPGEGKGYPLQYSGWENSKDHIVHGVAKNRTRLSLPKSVPSSAFLLDFPLISVATLE